MGGGPKSGTVSKNESDLAYPFKLDSACELAENNQQRDGLSSFRQPTPESGLVDGLDFVELETHSQRGLGIYDRGGRAEGSIAMSDAYLHRRPLGQRINQQTLDHRATVRSQDRKSLVTRDAYFKGVGVVATPLLHRDDLTARLRKGPFIVEEYDATVVVPPGWKSYLDSIGNIVIDLDE